MATNFNYDGISASNASGFVTSSVLKLPQQPPKAEKKAAKKPAVEIRSDETKKIAPAKLNLGQYESIGASLHKRIESIVKSSPERNHLLSMSEKVILSHIPAANRNIISELKATLVPGSTKDSKVKTQFDIYNSDSAGKQALAVIRETDQSTKKLFDRLVKTYVKISTDKLDNGQTIASSWAECKERKLITAETYYALATLSKYMIGSFINTLLQFRCREMSQENKPHRLIEINNTVLRHFLDAIRDGKLTDLPNFPFFHLMVNELNVCLRHFPEPTRKKIGEEVHEVDEGELESDVVADDEEEESGISFVTLVADIMKKIRLDQAKLTDKEKPVNIRTTKRFKEIIAHIISQFNDKIVRGIYLYTVGAQGKTDIGVKIDIDVLNGRLQQIIQDSTDLVYDAKAREAELQGLKSFVDHISDDFIAHRKYRSDLYMAKLADKEGKTLVDLQQVKSAREVERETKALAKEAAASGLTVPAYLKLQQDKQALRAATHAAAQKKKEDVQQQTVQKQIKHAHENRVKLEELKKKIAEELTKPIPPPSTLQLASAQINTSIAASISPTKVEGF